MSSEEKDEKLEAKEEGKVETQPVVNVKEEKKKARKKDIYEMNETELLRELLKFQKKENRHARRSAIFAFIFCLILLGVAVIIVPRVLNTLTNIDTAVQSANEALQGMDDVMANINSMSTSIEKTSESMNDMITDNAEGLTDAVQKLEGIDFDGLNTAIQDLEDAIGPFATFMNRLR